MPDRLHKIIEWFRCHRRAAIAGPLVPVVVGLVAPVSVWICTAAVRHPRIADVPRTPVAMVLGAGLDGATHPSPFLAERIAVAVGLYRAGKVRALLMSGDNSRQGYDEVGVMAAEAIRQGVPSAAVVQDHAGFDTYSSCYRARSVWGLRSVVVVTQPFHLPRAVWLCHELGLDAVGAATRGDDDQSATWYGWVREVPAIDKSLLDLALHRTPTFPGPRDHALDALTADALAAD